MIILANNLMAAASHGAASLPSLLVSHQPVRRLDLKEPKVTRGFLTSAPHLHNVHVSPQEAN